jgi:adenylate cyclase
MAEDEAATVHTLSDYREEIGLLVRQHRGRVVDTAGDSLLAEFPTATDAVSCAVEIQGSLGVRNAALTAERRMEFRIGIHLGEVRVEAERIYGDGVNIAARLEGLAEAGGVCISATVHEQVRNKLDLGYVDLGDQTVKNIPDQVRVYRIQPRSELEEPMRQSAAGRKRPGRLRHALVATAAVLLLIGIGLWASWPRPLGLLIDVMGVSGPPINPPLPDNPSIVVLPFANMSGDPEQEYFSDGITEDLTTDLSHNPYLFVISRNSAFTYRGQAVNVEDVGRELGVRYVLEGSVRKSAGRVRITAQLIDATTGFHLWSQRYDRDLADIFALQSEISEQILAAVGVEIDQAERERARRKPPENLTAYDMATRGLFHFLRFRRSDNAEARRLFESAIQLAENPTSVSGLGLTYAIEYQFGWNLDLALMDRAEDLAQRAIELDASHPEGYSLLAQVHLSREESTQAVAAARRAVELHPNADHTNAILGAALLQDGDYLAGLQSVKRAIRLNPRAPSIWWTFMAMANIMAERHNEAVDLLERVRSDNPDNLIARVLLAAIWEASEETVGVNHHDEATAVVQEILQVNPDLTAELGMRLIPTGDLLGPQEISRFTGWLRSAGLP